MSEALREDGQTIITVDSNSLLFDGLNSEQKVLLTHGDSVTPHSVSKQMKVIANSGGFVAGISFFSIMQNVILFNKV